MTVIPSFLALWLLPLSTAVAALACAILAIAGRRADPSYPRASRASFAARVVLGAGAAVALTLLAIASSALFSAAKATVSIGPRLARVGSLDAAFNTMLTPAGAILAAAALVAALAYAASAPRDAAPSEAASVGLATTGALEAALAEGFPMYVAGWGVIAIAAAALIGRRSARGGRAAAGLVASATGVVLAAAVLFWSLGGQFLDGRRFLSDYEARYTVVTLDPGREGRSTQLDPRAAPGELSMLGPPGARVFLGVANEAQLTPRLPPDAVAPFQRLELAPGVQKIVIDAGGGTIIGGDGHDIGIVDNVRVQPGAKLAVKTVGSTLSFREISEQFAGLSPATPGKLDPSFKSRAIAGIPVLDLAAAGALLALAGAALALGRAAARGVTAAAFAGLGGVVLAGSLVDRLGATLAGSGTFALGVAALASAVAVWSALVATRARTLGALVGRASGAAVALAAVSIAVPSTTSAISFAGAMIAAVALAAAVERLADPLRNSVDPTVSAAARPAVVAMGLTMAVGAAAIAAGALARGGALGVGIALAAVATAALLAWALARATAFMSLVELVPVEVTAKPSKKRKKGKGAAAAAEDAPTLAQKPVDKPSFPLPRQVIAIASAAGLGAATGALYVARGLGTPATTVTQIGVAASVVALAAAVAWRMRRVLDDAKRREASFAELSILASAASADEPTAAGSLLAGLAAGVRAIERGLLLPLDRLAGARRELDPKEPAK